MANHGQLADEDAQDLIASWAEFHDLPGAHDLVAENETESLFSDATGFEDPLDFTSETPSWMELVLAK